MESEQASGGHESSPFHSEQMAGISPGVTAYPQAIQKVLRRALMAKTALRNAQMLWIDDSPDWINWEKQLLKKLGVEVTVAQSTEEAVAILASRTFPLIISDIARGEDKRAGLTGLSPIREAAPESQVIFYVADLDEEKGPPPGSMGITNRPDELLHLILDVLERC